MNRVFDMPKDVKPTAADVERGRRCRASVMQRAAAFRAMQEAGPEADRALLPLTFPGKTRGVWVLGQTVEHPQGVFACSDEGHSVARAAAEALARTWLDTYAGGRGTVGTVVIYRDGQEAVFEGF